MSNTIQKVRAYLKTFGIDNKIKEFEASSATVELAAKAVGTDPARIAKTLSFQADDRCLLIVCAGDTKIDNAKYKSCFHTKAKMLAPNEVFTKIGHDIGGVCPFAVNDGVLIYLDQSLRRFETVYPACGSANSAIELSPEEIYRYANASGWVDVCKNTEI